VSIGSITRAKTKKLKEALNEIACTKHIKQDKPRGAWDIEGA
jgi:hypothetical protein